MEKWFVAMKKADFRAIAGKYHISPILARLIRNRDVTEDKEIDFYLNGTIADLHDGMLMKDMDKAAEILVEKLREGLPIRVIGDYDIDGVNATYILQEGLAGLGADVDTDIPDRIKDGYGLNRMLIDRALGDGIDTIITCDNGIAAAKEIEYAKRQGMTVIVTDHHEVPYEEIEEDAGEGLQDTGGFYSEVCVHNADGKSVTRRYLLPPADAIIDPHQADCEYPFKGLCGAAVAYKLVETLYEVMQRDVDDIDYLMENVAIATIGDVMNLTGENRIFVKQGLEMLKRTRNQGLKALMECTGVDPQQLNTYHIAFVIGPCINAGGRLDTAKRALELLNAKTRREAVMLAEDLKALNDSRKEMTEKGVLQAAEQIDSTSLKEDKVLVVFLPDCHESIAGIIAGRIRDRYYRPTLILTRAEGEVKGSGRSIDVYNMYEEMSKCKELFTKFGGHKIAAGVSLPEENVELFRKKINELADLSDEDLIPKVSIDMQLPLTYITENLIRELELLEPCGKGNVKPLFAERNLKVIAPEIIGKNQNVLRFQVEDERGNRMPAIYFGEVEDCLRTIENSERMSFTYYPSINEYRGEKKMQMRIVNYKAATV